MEQILVKLVRSLYGNQAVNILKLITKMVEIGS